MARAIEEVESVASRHASCDSGTVAASTLKLFAAQLDAALCDIESPVNMLDQKFVEFSLKLAELGLRTDVIATEELAEVVQSLNTLVCQCVVALQFPDRMSQRIRHVEEGLVLLGGLLADRQERDRPSSWKDLHTAVRGRYSMVEEHEVADRQQA